MLKIVLDQVLISSVGSDGPCAALNISGAASGARQYIASLDELDCAIEELLVARHLLQEAKAHKDKGCVHCTIKAIGAQPKTGTPGL